MKTFKIMSYAVLMLGFLLSSGMPGAEAATFLGDFCWKMANGGNARLGVTDMGGGHFLVQGQFFAVGVAHGNAEIIGQQVIVTMNCSEEDASQTRTATMRLVLNLSNLNGTIESLRLDHNKSDSDPKSAVIFRDPPQALTFIPCS